METELSSLDAPTQPLLQLRLWVRADFARRAWEVGLLLRRSVRWATGDTGWASYRKSAPLAVGCIPLPRGSSKPGSKCSFLDWEVNNFMFLKIVEKFVGMSAPSLFYPKRVLVH